MPQLISATTIMGDPVVNAAGDDLGKIEELMLGTANGQIEYAVVSFGGFLGMGDKLFAVPWKKLTLQQHEHRFMLDLPRETLEKAPGFDKNNWPDTADAAWSAEIDQYYGGRA
ncbi:MAG: PRC-barrel domain-containing protein [Chloroflexi bacterium]|nr:PRC-barrel domain-containing protein [Chloroflexota bacterium]MDA1239593.1 PRC-barrel domain-containing protein [Chloroflexota bacterium]